MAADAIAMGWDMTYDSTGKYRDDLSFDSFQKMLERQLLDQFESDQGENDELSQKDYEEYLKNWEEEVAKIVRESEEAEKQWDWGGILFSIDNPKELPLRFVNTNKFYLPSYDKALNFVNGLSSYWISGCKDGQGTLVETACIIDPNAFLWIDDIIFYIYKIFGVERGSQEDKILRLYDSAEVFNKMPYRYRYHAPTIFTTGSKKKPRSRYDSFSRNIDSLAFSGGFKNSWDALCAVERVYKKYGVIDVSFKPADDVIDQIKKMYFKIVEEKKPNEFTSRGNVRLSAIRDRFGGLYDLSTIKAATIFENFTNL